MSSETEYIIYSYFEVNHLLRICDHQTIVQVLKRYPQELPTLTETLESGLVKMLKYLIYQGLEINTKHLQIALNNDNFEIIKYLCNIIPSKTLIDYLSNTKIELKMLMYLTNIGIKLDQKVLDNAFASYDDIRFKFLCSVGYRGSENFLNAINSIYTLSACYIENVGYLIDCDIIDPTELLKIATTTKNKNLIHYLQNK